MLRWFPRLQVATVCFSCSPPGLIFLDPYFTFMYKHYNHCHRVTTHLQLKYYCYYYYKYTLETEPIPVLARSKAWVCGTSLPGIAGSNPAHITSHVIVVCCQAEVSGCSLIRRSPPECCVSAYVRAQQGPLRHENRN
jgi:hypothetical protein